MKIALCQPTIGTIRDPLFRKWISTMGSFMLAESHQAILSDKFDNLNLLYELPSKSRQFNSVGSVVKKWVKAQKPEVQRRVLSTFVRKNQLTRQMGSTVISPPINILKYGLPVGKRIQDRPYLSLDKKAISLAFEQLDIKRFLKEAQNGNFPCADMAYERGLKPNGTKNNAKHSPTSQSADSGDGVLHF